MLRPIATDVNANHDAFLQAHLLPGCRAPPAAAHQPETRCPAGHWRPGAPSSPEEREGMGRERRRRKGRGRPRDSIPSRGSHPAEEGEGRRDKRHRGHLLCSVHTVSRSNIEITTFYNPPGGAHKADSQSSTKQRACSAGGRGQQPRSRESQPPESRAGGRGGKEMPMRCSAL